MFKLYIYTYVLLYTYICNLAICNPTVNAVLFLPACLNAPITISPSSYVWQQTLINHKTFRIYKNTLYSMCD